MSIKQNGGVFGRNPKFNDVEVESLTIGGNAVPDASTLLVDSDIGSTVQGYDADIAKYDDATANFTGTLQENGNNVVTADEIGSTVQGYDANTAKYDDVTANFTGTLQENGNNVVTANEIGTLASQNSTDVTITGATDGDPCLTVRANNNGSVEKNILVLKDIDAAVVNGQSMGAIKWESSDTNYPGTMVRINASQRGTLGGGEFRIQTATSSEATLGTRIYCSVIGEIGVTGNLTPNANGTLSLGKAGALWSEVFASTGTINTSDERKKQDIRELSDAEKAVAIRLKSLVKAFKYKDSVERKGDDARLHVGVIAQEVKAAFEAEGLNGFDYGILCYDQWEEEVNEQLNVSIQAGDSFGVRYSELAMFIIAAL